MAVFIHFCTCMLFVLVTVLHAQEENSYCSVGNTNPSIEENNDPGVVIANITTAAGVTVTIDSASTMNPQWFEINGSQLILQHSVDYEETTVLLVELKCWSGGIEENSLVIVLTVTNVNDNPPVFGETNITVNVNEDTKVNTIIVPQATVTATDADADIIFYNLTGSPTELEYFNIQGVNNPQITLLKPLDYETINLMKFILYAMDGNAGEPGVHTATAEITIHILQADLRPPWFQPCTPIGGNIVCISRGYTGKVNASENMTEPLVLEPGPLYAIDGDRDLNETIVYEIAAGNDDNTFSINKYTGNITMNKPVNTLKTFILYIVASQENNPFRYSQTTVEIQVVLRNDHKPDFNTTYRGTVSVDLPVSSLVMETGRPSVPLKIFAADYDFPDGINPDIKYEIQNSSDFRVTSDGFLLTTAVLNMPSTITLLVIANDTVALQAASTLITVDVLPLATTTIPATTTTSTTSTATSPAPTTTLPGMGITTSRPSSSSSSLPPGINSSLSTVPSGPTTSTTPPASTTRNTGNLGSTGKPVTAPGPGGATQSTTTAPGPGGPTESTSSTTTTTPGLGGPTPPTTTVSGPGGPTQSTSSTTTTAPGSGGPTPSTTTVPGPGGPTQSTSSTTTTAPGPGGPTPSTTTAPGPGGPTQSTSSTTTTAPGPGGPTPSTTTAPGPGGPTQSTSSTTTTTPGPGGPTQSTSSTTTTAPGPGGPTSSTTTAPGPGGPTQLTSSTTTTTPGPGGITQSTSSTTTTAPGPGGPTSSTTTAPEPGGPTQSTSSTTTTTPGPGGATQSTRPASSSTDPSTTGLVRRDKYEKDMAILGGILGGLLAITLVLLGLISYKYYKLKNGEDNTKFIENFSNSNFENDEKPNDEKPNSDGEAAEASLDAGDDSPDTPSPLEKGMESSLASAASEAIENEDENEDSEKEVKSILTKDRRVEDDGYKAVWFKEDIDPEAEDDVLVIEDDSDAEQNQNESDGDGNGEEDVDDDDDDDDHGGGSGDNDSGRGSGDVSIIPGRPHLPEAQFAPSESLETKEENDIYL